MSDIEPGEALSLATKAGAPPTSSFVLTPTAKVGASPGVHAHAFELSDKSGWFGSSTRLVLRATSAEDAAEWTAAIEGVQQALIPVSVV